MSLQSQINTNTALILQLKNQVNPDIATLQQEVTDLQNDKYDKTGGLISGDVDLSGNLTFTNAEEGGKIYTQGALSVISQIGGGSSLILNDELEGFTMSVESSPGNTGLFTTDLLRLNGKNIDVRAEEGRFVVNTDMSRMEMALGENVNGNNLALVADENGNEIASNTKLTIQGDGDVVIKNQDGVEGKVSIESNSIIELKPAVGKVIQVASNGSLVSHQIDSNDVSNITYLINLQKEDGERPDIYSMNIGNDDATQLYLIDNLNDSSESLATLSSRGKTGIGDYYEVENGTR